MLSTTVELRRCFPPPFFFLTCPAPGGRGDLGGGRRRRLRDGPREGDLGRQLGRRLVLLDVREGGAERLHPGLPVVDAQRLPVQHVGEALRAVAHDDALAAVQAAEVVHEAAGRDREGEGAGNNLINPAGQFDLAIPICLYVLRISGFDCTVGKS